MINQFMTWMNVNMQHYQSGKNLKIHVIDLGFQRDAIFFVTMIKCTSTLIRWEETPQDCSEMEKNILCKTSAQISGTAPPIRYTI